MNIITDFAALSLSFPHGSLQGLEGVRA
jgi:hypothetical protein